MSTDETLQGWTNRETWALNLWLRNDQGLYEMTRERVAEAVHEEHEDVHDPELEAFLSRVAGEAVKDFYEELTDPDEGLMSAENILTMVKDIGSVYRINWDELGGSFLEELPGLVDSQDESSRIGAAWLEDLPEDGE